MTARKRPVAPADAPFVSASEFKATCLELMDEIARNGRDLIVTKRGEPVVRVTAVSTQAASPWGFLQGTIVRHGDITAADGDAWAASPTDPLSRRGSR